MTFQIQIFFSGPNVSPYWVIFVTVWTPHSGQAALPLLQHAGQGDRPHQVFPRLLLRVSEDALRHPAEEMPQVQLRLRSQRLPPHLHHLSGRARDTERERRDWTKGEKRPEGGAGGLQIYSDIFNRWKRLVLPDFFPFGDQTWWFVCLSVLWAGLINTHLWGKRRSRMLSFYFTRTSRSRGKCFQMQLFLRLKNHPIL